MAQETITKIVVINAAHSGYRRAGVGFNQGKNLFDTSQFNETQRAMLQDDPRLQVFEEQVPCSPSASGQKTGLLDADHVPSNLMEAIKQLDLDDKTHFTSTGKPQTDVLSELMRTPVSAAERDKAWDAFKANNQESV